MEDTLFTRLADYFAVIGITKHLKTDTPDNQLDHKVTSLALYAGYLNTDPGLLGSSTEKWLDLDGSQTLWLKIKFNEDRPAITKFGIYEIPEDRDGLLAVPISNGIFPVPIYKIGCSRESDHLTLENKERTLLFKGEFNLAPYLGVKPKKRNQLVLCIKKQNVKNYRIPLNDIIVLPVEKNKKDELVVANLPDQYKTRKFKFGKQPNCSILAYRKCPDIEKLSFSPGLLSRYPQKNYASRELQSAIAMFCFPSGITLSRIKRTQKSFSFILTQQDGQRIYATCLIFDELLPERYLKRLPYVNDDQDQTFFVQKALCITSPNPFTEQFTEVLKGLYNIHLTKSELPLERYICNFIDEVPAPLRGESCVSYSLGTKNILFKLSAEYPFVSDRCIKNLFTKLSLKTILLLFELVLLERQIFLVSTSKSLLMDITDALTALIFPLAWTQVLIPILPQSLKAYAEAPVPFIIGIENCDGAHEILDNLDSNAYKVDLDTDTLVFNEELPSMPEKELTNLIKHLKKFSRFFYKRDCSITNYDEAFLHSYEKIQGDKSCLQIRDAFFQFMCSILQDSHQFSCTKSPHHQMLNKASNDFFDFSGFLNTANNKFCKEHGSKFMKRLTEATHFSYFIQTRFLESPKDKETLFIRPALKCKLDGKNPLHLSDFNPENIFQAPLPNDADLPPKKVKGESFYTYDIFPKLKAEYFSGSRIATWSPSFIQQRSPLMIPKKPEEVDDTTWEKLIIQNLFESWFIFTEAKIQHSDCNYYPRMAERALSLFEEYRSQQFPMKASIVRSVVQILCYVWMEDKALRLLTKICDEQPDLLQNPHAMYLTAIAKAKECENSLNYIDSPLISMQEVESGTRRSLYSTGKNPSQTSTQSEGRKSDPFQDCSPLLSMTSIENYATDKMNQDELTPYSYYISIDNPKIKPEEVLKFWKAKKTTRSLNLFQGNNQKIMLSVEERKLEDIKKIQIEWKSPVDLRNQIEIILKSNNGPETLNKLDQKDPELYWNLIAAFQLIKAPTIFFESSQNAVNIARAMKKIEAEITKAAEEEKEKPSKTPKNQTTKKKFAVYFNQFLQENEALQNEMKALNTPPCGSLNSLVFANEVAKEHENENRPSIPSIELLICEEEELKKDSMETCTLATRQEHFRHRNTPDSNIRRPAALQIRKNAGLSRFGQEFQKAKSQNSNICGTEEKKIETTAQSESCQQLS